MTTLTQAPLVEVIFELRWGRKSQDEGESGITYGPEDLDLFLGQFKKTAEGAGYPVLEPISGAPHLPFVVTHRFRPSDGGYPLHQVGLGIYTFNQINDGYDWDTFKPGALEGVRILGEGHPAGLSGLPALGAELRFIDGLVFEKGESPLEFINSKLQLKFEVPERLKESSAIGEELDSRLVFGLKTVKPAGVLVLELRVGTINGQPGLIVHTVVRSMGEDCPEPTVDSMSVWLEEAHDVQRHTFLNLIKPAYLKEME